MVKAHRETLNTIFVAFCQHQYFKVEAKPSQGIFMKPETNQSRASVKTQGWRHASSQVNSSKTASLSTMTDTRPINWPMFPFLMYQAMQITSADVPSNSAFSNLQVLLIFVALENILESLMGYFYVAG